MADGGKGVGVSCFFVLTFFEKFRQYHKRHKKYNETDQNDCIVDDAYDYDSMRSAEEYSNNKR